ncbi:DUF5681 domain-containing protein [Nitrobacter sp.]|uniref:DUF5681 domain-containing protein n=1 Tax=Nitrobacter sp. TaxID=29420 RepID=UPI00321FC267
MMAPSRKASSSKSPARAHLKGQTAKGHIEATDDSASVQDRVGYGKPPKHNQWQKGVSGNRAGRKNGSKNKRTIIIELMEQRLGRRIDDISKLSRYEGMLLKGIQKALGGDTKAMAFILRRYDDAESLRSRAELTPSEQDEIVYATLVEKIKRELSETKQ